MTRPRLSVMAALWLSGRLLVAAAADPAPQPPLFHAGAASAAQAAQADQSLALLIFKSDTSPAWRVIKERILASTNFLNRAGFLHAAVVDVDSDPQTAARFSVRSVPTLVLLGGEERIVARREGGATDDLLLTWLAEGRRRAKAGQWEGIAPPLSLDGLAQKAAADQLNETDIQRLVALVGDPDPAQRAAVGKMLLGARELSASALIEALADPYLGTRIAAADLLRRLAPEGMVADPWQSPLEQTNQLAALRKWRAEAGVLSSAQEAQPADPSAEAAIKNAVESVLSGGAGRQTEAMSALAGRGQAVLPALRDGLKRAARAENHRAAGLLEDVRWAVLVPDALERQAGPLRQVLARGKSPDRQAAAAKLGAAGREAVPALAELLGDPEPLVVESAVRALSGVRGKDAIPALAGLLKAPDSNLRMSTARALGHLKSPAAAQPLTGLVDDPDEGVACMALAALEEAAGENAKECPPEIEAALKRALGDARWRVRAAAAEAAGKVRAGNLAEPLGKLLEDGDSFVAKSALQSLRALEATPEVAKLAALSRRHSSLRGDVIAILVQSKSDTAAPAVMDLYAASAPRERLTMLEELAPRAEHFERRQPLGTNWQPLLAKAAGEPEAGLRRQGAALLSASSFEVITNLAGALLSDDDGETRARAAAAVLRALSIAAGGSEADQEDEDLRVGLGRSGKAAKRLLAETQRTAWNQALERHARGACEARIALAHYLTGNNPSNTAVLLGALRRSEPQAAEALGHPGVVTALLARLPWPHGRPVAEALERAPLSYARALASSGQFREEIKTFLMEPARFRRVAEGVRAADLQAFLELLFGRASPSWSPQTAPPGLLEPLHGSTNAVWRTLAVHVAAQRKDGTNTLVFETAIRDENPFVRLAGVSGFARHCSDRAQLEERLGPLVLDTNRVLAFGAAVALLEPEVQTAASLDGFLQRFVFENIMVARFEGRVGAESRPLASLERKPAFLEELVRRLPDAAEADAAVLALVLAQYGRGEGLDHCLKAGSLHAAGEWGASVLLAGVALVPDPKYVPAIRAAMEGMPSDWELRKLLAAVKGMRGAEARQLRLDINKRMRKSD